VAIILLFIRFRFLCFSFLKLSCKLGHGKLRIKLKLWIIEQIMKVNLLGYYSSVLLFLLWNYTNKSFLLFPFILLFSFIILFSFILLFPFFTPSLSFLYICFFFILSHMLFLSQSAHFIHFFTHFLFPYAYFSFFTFFFVSLCLIFCREHINN
jgi:hypothetical protein